MIRTGLRGVFFLVLFALAGCAQPPDFGAAASGLPPVPAGMARMFFYRLREPYESTSFSTVYLNHQPVGNSQDGAVFYRDEPPGQYLVSVFSPGLYPDQFKTVTVTAGEVVYVRIASLQTFGDCSGKGISCDRDTFVVNTIEPKRADREMADLWLIRG